MDHVLPTSQIIIYINHGNDATQNIQPNRIYFSSHFFIVKVKIKNTLNQTKNHLQNLYIFSFHIFTLYWNVISIFIETGEYKFFNGNTGNENSHWKYKQTSPRCLHKHEQDTNKIKQLYSLCKEINISKDHLDGLNIEATEHQYSAKFTEMENHPKQIIHNKIPMNKL